MHTIFRGNTPVAGNIIRKLSLAAEDIRAQEKKKARGGFPQRACAASLSALMVKPLRFSIIGSKPPNAASNTSRAACRETVNYQVYSRPNVTPLTNMTPRLSICGADTVWNTNCSGAKTRPSSQMKS